MSGGRTMFKFSPVRQDGVVTPARDLRCSSPRRRSFAWLGSHSTESARQSAEASRVRLPPVQRRVPRQNASMRFGGAGPTGDAHPIG